MKSQGQLAYERDVKRTPRYHDGAPRKAWEQLTKVARDSWERNPTDTYPATIETSKVMA